MKKTYSVASVLLFLISITIQAQSGINSVNSTEVASLIQKNKKLVILDVRTPSEYAQGHLANSINIDVNQPDVKDRLEKLDKNASYLVYCRTKNRSGVVANYMIQNGFTSVYQMMDGITGWNMNNLPVER